MKASPIFLKSIRRRGWITLDLVLAAVSILLAYALQPNMKLGWSSSNWLQPGPLVAALTYPWLLLLTAHIAGLHDPLGSRNYWLMVLRIAIAVSCALVLYVFLLYWVSLMQLGRTILIRAFLISVTLHSVTRPLIWRLSTAASWRVGTILNPAAQLRFTRLVHLSTANVPVEIVHLPTQGVVTEAAEIADFFHSNGVREVVVAAAQDTRSEIWLSCLNRGVQVIDISVFVEREYYRVACDDVDLRWFVTFDLAWHHPFYHRLKRILDIVGTSLGLLATMPIVAIAALCIWIEDRGPIFYKQARVGFRGKLYLIWKLRTMRADAESAGAQWAKRADSRVTRIGRLLRRSRIDELPQFWNVLRGDMSLIGPRPERPEFVEQLAKDIPLYPQRHWVKPGITGWAQINYSYGASIEDAREKLCYDLYYLRNASLLLDLHIALRTLGVIMKGSR